MHGGIGGSLAENDSVASKSCQQWRGSISWQWLASAWQKALMAAAYKSVAKMKTALWHQTAAAWPRVMKM